MKKIQVDMYAVGLGAAILVQIRVGEGKVIRVLADGGMGHGGYRAEGVRDRIDDAYTSFSSDIRRLDLIIGTHYDGDHLRGLIPIVEDDSLQIGEVWLPPIRDDSDEVPGHISEDSGFLADRFYEDDSEETLLRYLNAKFQDIKELDEAEQSAVAILQEAAERTGYVASFPLHRIAERDRESKRLREGPRSIEEFLSFFVLEEEHAARSSRTEAGHGAAEFDSSALHIRDLARENQGWAQLRGVGRNQLVEALAEVMPGRARLLPGILANVRKSTAANAITSIHLQKLVVALKNRATPVRPKCQYIKAGSPVRYTWDERLSRFIARASNAPQDVTLQLLGPSDTLVERYRERLPVGSYAEALAFMRTTIPREGITASNQLSYILVLEAHEQRVLITGDSGCYDFRDDDGSYYSRLLAALTPLHVVQVAHHGGRNYDFYNCLLEANMASQRERAFLLLSHDYHDKTRPSDAFRNFIAQVRSDGDDVRLLFTSEPTLARVRDFDELIVPVVPAGSRKPEGDVRLVFETNRGLPAWNVEQHAIAV